MFSTTTTWRPVINGALHAGSAMNGAPTLGKNVIFTDAQAGDIYHNSDAAAAMTFTPADIDYTGTGSESRLTVGGRNSATSVQNWDINAFQELVLFDGTLNATDRATVFFETSAYWFNETYDL